jgi:glycosyltransferase involved in cell wall biosynthesis
MINHFPLEGSGSGTYTKNLAVSLTKKGHEVCIIMPENTQDYPQLEGVRLHPVFFTDDGIASGGRAAAAPEGALGFNFPCFTSHPRSVTTFADLDDAQLEAYKTAFTAAIKEEISAHRPDVIHGQHVWILPSLAAGLGIPLVLTAHGTDLMGADKWPELKPYAETALGDAKYVISISKDNCELLEKTFPGCSDKIVMMRNGFNENVFYPAGQDRKEMLEGYGIEYSGEKIVMFAGKLANFKGIDILLRAAAKYENEEPKTITLIAGDGDERDKLHALAKDLELRTVHFLGNVDQAALAKLYNIGDVSLVPSRREPFGLVAIEAMACGTPVIASNQGGLPDFVNDSVGRLVTPEDPDDLAEAVIQILKRTEEEEGWREKIAAYAKGSYSQDAIISELERLYEKTL